MIDQGKRDRDNLDQGPSERAELLSAARTQMRSAAAAVAAGGGTTRLPVLECADRAFLLDVKRQLPSGLRALEPHPGGPTLALANAPDVGAARARRFRRVRWGSASRDLAGALQMYVWRTR